MNKFAYLYFNLTRKIFSVKVGDKVVDHTDNALVLYPEFVVQEGGRQRVIREKKKYVHAFVKGKLLEPGTREYVQTEKLVRGMEWRKARYNPFTGPTFVDSATGEPVYRATAARLTIVDKRAVLEYTWV